MSNTKYISELVEKYRQQALNVKIASERMLFESRELVRLNVQIYDECQKNNIDIDSLKLASYVFDSHKNSEAYTETKRVPRGSRRSDISSRMQTGEQ